jgi:curved DNA-binding protein CbpA
MDDEMENAYEVLGLTQGFQSTEGEIKKVYTAPRPPRA